MTHVMDAKCKASSVACQPMIVSVGKQKGRVMISFEITYRNCLHIYICIYSLWSISHVFINTMQDTTKSNSRANLVFAGPKQRCH
jgi:hypothetical protein